LGDFVGLAQDDRPRDAFFENRERGPENSSGVAFGEYDRLGIFLRLVPEDDMMTRPVPIRRSSWCLYSSISSWFRATPLLIAASATADDSQIRIRRSNGLGMIYSRPEFE